MIKPQHFIGLAVAAFLSVIAALAVYASTNRWSNESIEGAALVPGLSSKLANVKAIEITQGGKTLTIAQGDKGWQLREKGGYPARLAAVRTLLLALADSKLVEPKTSLKDKLGLLELEDPAGKDAKSKRVRLLNGSNGVMADLVFGKTHYDAFGSGRGGTYVRNANENQSWLATGDAKISSNITDWTDVSLFKVDKDDIEKVVLTPAGEKPIVIAKGPPPEPATPAPNKDEEKAKLEKSPTPPKAEKDKAKYHVVDMPAGEVLKKDARLDDIPDGFSLLEFDDVRKLDSTPVGNTVSVARIEDKDGLSLTFRVHKDGEDRWISFTAEGKNDKARKEAEALNDKAKGWEFKIPSWRGDLMARTHAELFEKKG
ncbi:MAG: DUF4340 domain-containing protein [Hyphomicrobiaceae bacterium]